MKGKKEVAWAVEYFEKGKRHVEISYADHSSPQKACAAFAKRMGTPWKELEQKGAKVVKREIVVYPSGTTPWPPKKE